MKTSTLLAVTASLIQTIEGVSIGRRDDGLKVVSLDMERRAARNPVHRDKLRKRDTVSVDLDNKVRFDLSLLGCSG